MAHFLTSNYDIRQLRTFMTVVEHGGLSAAAYRLGTSLSSVSRDVHALETRLGVALCKRGRSGFALTPHGADVHRAATSLLSALHTFEQTVDNTRKSLGGTFMFGTIDSIVTNPEAGIVQALARMHRLFPDTQVNVSTHTVSLIDMKVRDGELDLGVTGQPEDLAQLIYEPAFKETQRLYISRDSRYLAQALASVDKPRVSTQPIPYISRDYRSDMFKPFEHEFPVKIVARGSTLESIHASVLAGVGCAILPSHLADGYGGDQLIEIPTRLTPIHVQFHFVYRRDAVKRRSIRAMLDCFRET